MSTHAASQTDLADRIAELEAALKAEKSARAEALAESRMATDRMATVSHEVRTAVGAITAMADLLHSSELDDVQQHYVETLLQSSRSLLTVLNDILDFTKLEAGQFKVQSVAFDVRGFADELRTVLSAQAGDKGLASELVVADACPARLVGDPARLRQVMNNLISNAVKFTADGSIRILVDFEDRRGVPFLRCEVADTGVGLSDDEQARLFRPYEQLESHSAAEFGGTGLGLSIARQIAELMQGTLDVESAPGKGSTFSFTARVERSVERKSLRRRKTRKRAMDGPLSGHALIVEDNSVNQTLIAAYLDRFGITYDLAANGRQAVAAVEERVFDLILMDVMMPEMDGIEATKAIRALDGEPAGIPIIALTANAMRGDRESYLASGMDGYVSKPMDANALFQILADHLPSAREDSPIRETG